MSTINVHSISHALGGRQILTDVSLELGKDQMTAIIGINGAGKSTFLRILAGIDLPSAGHVSAAGQPLLNLNAKERTRTISFVAQDETPPAEMSVYDFVALGRLPYQGLFARNSATDSEAIQSVLHQVGLADLAARSCGELSGGQRHRVVLARGLAQQSEFLLLDEPTNHLDVKHQQSILELLRHTGSPVVAAVHDLDLVMCFFDRVIVLHDGEVFADGIPRQVLNKHVVSHVFGVKSAQVSVPGSKVEHLVIEGLK